MVIWIDQNDEDLSLISMQRNCDNADSETVSYVDSRPSIKEQWPLGREKVLSSCDLI